MWWRWVCVAVAAAVFSACGDEAEPGTGGQGTERAGGEAGDPTAGRQGDSGETSNQGGESGEPSLGGTSGNGAAGGGHSSGGSSRGGAGAMGGAVSGATSGRGAGGGSAGDATGGAGVGGAISAGAGGSTGGAGAGGAGAGAGGSAGLGEPPCDPSSCLNGGTCQDGVAGCVCPVGYFGPDCGLSLCDPNPCLHGACGGPVWLEPFACTCDPGWEGLRCGVDIDECRKNNGGCDARTSCTNVPGGRVCGACPPGYVGTGESGCQQAPCSTAGECTSAFGAVAGCSAWQCVGGYCEQTAACVDGDGDGVSAWSSCGCGAVDCDDGDDDTGERESCYTGPTGTEGVGSCRGGTRRCVGPGGAGRCGGEVTPSAETCNGVDDDCNGQPDDGLPSISCGVGACRVTAPACTSGAPSTCTPLSPLALVDGCNEVDDDCDGAVDEDCSSCVHVAPDGDDEAALLSDGASPFGNVQPALDFAASNGVGRVCVAAGSACGATAHYYGPPGQNLTMRDGVDLVANYESTTFTHCDDSTTVLWPRTDLGVYFPAGIEGPVRLDGFRIELGVFGSGTAAAVTLIDARGVLLSNLVATSDPGGVVSGVNLLDGSDATIVRSRIFSTFGGVAVRSFRSRVSIEASCPNPGGSGCGNPNPLFDAPCSIGGAEAHGVFLEDSPGSRVETSGICGNLEPDMLAMLVAGDAAGTVVASSSLSVNQGSDYGQGAVRVEHCGAATPRFFNNPRIGSGSGDSTKAFEALGDCRPVLEHSGSVSAIGTEETTAISCRGSGCVLSSNVVTAGSTTYPVGGDHVGIECDAGCARLDGNSASIFADSAYPNGSSRTIELRATGAFVDRNVARASCYGNDVGMTLSNAWSRVQNNLVVGRFGCWVPVTPRSGGVGGPALVVHTGPDGEADVHSNRVVGGEQFAAPLCFSTSPEDQWPTVSLSAVAGVPFATLRNNEIVRGACDGAVVGFGPGGSLVGFEHNQLTSAAVVGTTLVADARSSQRLGDIASVNALPGASGNRSDGVLVDTGTTVGAPTYDFDGNPRDLAPDIGAYEAP